jgi:hypothetical protein
MADDPEDESVADEGELGPGPLSAAELEDLGTGRMAAGPDEVRRLVDEVRQLRDMLAATFEYAEAVEEARRNFLGSKKASVSLLLEGVRRELWKRGFLGGPNPGRGN